MRIVIIGAGIGGLATAAALRRIGIASLVIEQVAGIREVGEGSPFGRTPCMHSVNSAWKPV